MLIIQDKLVSDELVEEHFICNLDKCKGACCWEGDMGAPLEEAEKAILDEIYPKVRPFLTEEGQKMIDSAGCYEYFAEMEGYGAKLLPDGKCAFLTFNTEGVGQCGIEQAWKAGAVDFQKPISCHLYPVRVSTNEIVGFESLNYDRWEICSAACQLGKKHKMPIYEFVKNALVRKYGVDFYDELTAAAQHLKRQNG
jgi:hypothetical protein